MVLISFKSISPITSPILPSYKHLNKHHSTFQFQFQSIKHFIKLILIISLSLIFYYLSYLFKFNLIFDNPNQSTTTTTTTTYKIINLNQSSTTQSKPKLIPGWIKLNHGLPTTTSLLEFTSPSSSSSSSQISDCESNWISSGIPCTSIKSKPNKLDILWTWVNGTTTQKPPSYQSNQLPDYLFRQHDELRYSIRSVIKSVPSTLINHLHLFTEDISFPSSYDSHQLSLYGSIPTWLNLTSINSSILLHHHSNAFKTSLTYLKSTAFGKNSSDHHSNSIHWRQSVVPSHNSLAIESQIPHLENLGKTLLYMNDDTFLLRPFTAGDLVTDSYGPVFRLQWDLKVQDREPSRHLTVGQNGEWPSLGYSNWLLSNRFGRRARRYLHHVAKVLPVESMKELAEIWADELSESASSAYRSHLPEINLPFLSTWYHIEKHRESILYSYIMLKSDTNSDGLISAKEFQNLFQSLSLQPNQTILKVPTPSRLTTHPLTIQSVLKAEEYPLQTQYSWVSSDGYPLQSEGSNQLSDYSDSSGPQNKAFCEIDLEVCFGNFTIGQPSEKVFKRISFENVGCGDCLVAKIVGESGLSNGLEFALPSSSSTTQNSWTTLRFFEGFLRGFGKRGREVKGFGNQKRWEDLKVLGTRKGKGKREMGIKLLKKYSYVIGNTPNTFRALTSEIGAKKFLEPLIENRDGKAMVTVNDLIVEVGAIKVFKNWLVRLWPEKLDFEI